MKSPNQFLFLGLAALLVASVSADQYRPHYPPPQPQNSLYCPDVKCPDCRPTLTCGACQECQKCQACQTCPDNTFQCPTLTLKCPDPAPVCCPGEHKDKKKHKCDNYVTELPYADEQPWDFVSHPIQKDVTRPIINGDVTATPADSINGNKCWTLGCCARSPLNIFALNYVREPATSGKNRNMEVRYADSVRLCQDYADRSYSLYFKGTPAESYEVSNPGFNPSGTQVPSQSTLYPATSFGPTFTKLVPTCGSTAAPVPDFYYLYGACYASKLNINTNPYAVPAYDQTICGVPQN